MPEVNITSKIFEYCILYKIQGFVNINKLQFGFTQGGGCEKAIYVAKNIIEYYPEYESNVYIASLDLLKAYGQVHHCKLWLKLFNINIPFDILLLFIYCYCHLFCVVVWRNSKSDILLKSVVRQGGVIACLLFNIYINELICKLNNSGNECFINCLIAECMFYVDDVLLLFSSMIKLQK